MRMTPAVIGILMVASVACGGGFYKIDDSVRRDVSTGGVPQDPGYITATIDLQNRKILTSAVYNDSRDQDLSHLYVFASFSGDVSGPRQIPLYLIDFDKGTIDDTRGDELISHFPIQLDARGKPLLKIQTRALKNNVADTALKVWNITKDVSQRLATLAFGKQASAVFGAVDDAAGVLQNLAATEKAYTAQIALPGSLESAEFADIYLILATDKHNEVLPVVKASADEFQKQAFTLCDQNGSTFACIDHKPYDKLPYIIVTFRVQNFVADPMLIPRLGPNCTEVDNAMIATSRARIAETRAVSDAQRVLEEAIGDRLDALLAIRKKLAANDTVGAFNAYDNYALLGDETDPSDLFKVHYKPNFDTVARCVQLEVSKLAGADDLRLIEEFLGLPLGIKTGEAELESDLVQVTALVRTDDDRAKTTPYARATARIVTIGNLLYQGFYLEPIRQLRAAKQRSNAIDAIADDVEHRYTNSNCDKCRSDGATAVAAYRALKPTDADVVRTAALVEAADTLASLKVEIAIMHKDQRSNPRLTEALGALTTATTKLQKSAAVERPRSLSELSAEVTRAASLIQTPRTR